MFQRAPRGLRWRCRCGLAKRLGRSQQQPKSNQSQYGEARFLFHRLFFVNGPAPRLFLPAADESGASEQPLRIRNP
jgi:hypothetical protein